MRLGRARLVMLVLALMIPLRGFSAETNPDTTPDTRAIEAVLQAQVDAWNRGDVNAFMQGYKDAPDTAFVGKTVEHGYAAILDRYRKKYASREQMGTLRFDDLHVRQLDAQVAVVTGQFHLTRSAAGGGDAAGVFSLVLQKTDAAKKASSWKIVLDHTS